MEDDSQPQKFFAGEFRHSIDEKNRITIPSRWRKPDGEEFIILPEPHHQYLVIMSAEEFARMSAQAESHRAITAPQQFVAQTIRLNGLMLPEPQPAAVAA